MSQTDAAQVVANQLARHKPGQRALFLRELMGHAAAQLTVIEGEEEAAESCYRLADAVVARRTRHG